MKKDQSEVVSRVLSEHVLSLKEAQIEIQNVTKFKVDKTSLTRWILKGVGGTKLEACRVGRMWITSKESITRFINARSAI